MVLPRQRLSVVNIDNMKKGLNNKKTEDCSHRTQSNPIQSTDGSNPCPTLC